MSAFITPPYWRREYAERVCETPGPPAERSTFLYWTDVEHLGEIVRVRQWFTKEELTKPLRAGVVRVLELAE